MKEIHDADFKFVPANCTASLHNVLSAPVPAHMLKQGTVNEGSEEPPNTTPGPATTPPSGWSREPTAPRVTPPRAGH